MNNPLATVESWLAFGANLGSPIKMFEQTIVDLNHSKEIDVIEYSSLYRTSPIDVQDTQPDYINAVIHIRTRLSPKLLLKTLKSLEHQAGRHSLYRNAPRPLDLDILLYDDQQIQEDNLQIPHPRMHQRAFVLAPLTELSPDIMIPKHGLAKALLAKVNSQFIERLK